MKRKELLKFLTKNGVNYLEKEEIILGGGIPNKIKDLLSHDIAKSMIS